MKLVELTEGLKLTAAMANELHYVEVETYDPDNASAARTAAYNWLTKHSRGGNLDNVDDDTRRGLIQALDNSADILSDQEEASKKRLGLNMKKLQHELEKIK